METKIPQKKMRRGREISLKALVLFVMLLIMQIPIFMIDDLINDRESLSDQTSEEILSAWGPEAVISSPTVMFSPQSGGKYEYLNADIEVKADVDPQELKRGIFTTRVYSAKVKYVIKFRRVDNIVETNITNPDPMALLVPTTGFKLKGQVNAKLNKEPLQAVGTDVFYSKFGTGTEFLIPGNRIPSQGDVIEVEFELLGSNELSFRQDNQPTLVEINSPWASPSFVGPPLPITRKVDKDGFQATWEVSEYDEETGFYPDTFGVKLISPVDHYRLTDRATKYALLFIALTFLAFFISEIVNKWRIHPVQYFLVGAAMVVFYSLLLSFSEQMGFGLAYLVSSAATILLISMYSITILQKNMVSSLVITILLVLLYLFLYLILQMEDYALMAGSILLFVTIGVAMFCLRNVKWYSEESE